MSVVSALRSSDLLKDVNHKEHTQIVDFVNELAAGPIGPKLLGLKPYLSRGFGFYVEELAGYVCAPQFAKVFNAAVTMRDDVSAFLYLLASYIATQKYALRESTTVSVKFFKFILGNLDGLNSHSMEEFFSLKTSLAKKFNSYLEKLTGFGFETVPQKCPFESSLNPKAILYYGALCVALNKTCNGSVRCVSSLNYCNYYGELLRCFVSKNFSRKEFLSAVNQDRQRYRDVLFMPDENSDDQTNSAKLTGHLCRPWMRIDNLPGVFVTDKVLSSVLDSALTSLWARSWNHDHVLFYGSALKIGLEDLIRNDNGTYNIRCMSPLPAFNFGTKMSGALEETGSGYLVDPDLINVIISYIRTCVLPPFKRDVDAFLSVDKGISDLVLRNVRAKLFYDADSVAEEYLISTPVLVNPFDYGGENVAN
jgi:hypothetical protein